MKYDDPALNDFINTKEWRKGLSTLSRIYESREFLDITGLVMDDKGQVGMALSDAAMKSVATTIVQGIKSTELNTRSLNKISSPRFVRLMSEVRDVSGTGSDSGSAKDSSSKKSSNSASGSAGGGAGSDSGTGGAKPGRKPPAPKPKTHYLQVGHLTVPSQFPKAVELHMEELSAIDIQKFPNATFLMLRAILEKTIKAFAGSKNIDMKKTNNTKGYVQLHDALAWLLDYVTQNGPVAMKQPISRLQGSQLVNYTATTDALNAINHNHNFHVDPSEVFNCYNAIDPILREVMKP